MFAQFAIGGALIVASTALAAIAILSMEELVTRQRFWLAKPPHGPKLTLILCLAALGALAQITAAVWLWALAFWCLGVFDGLEPALYFALVTFTTLGYGDIILGPDWRLLGGISAANGLLNFGFVTAALVEAVRRVRQAQRDKTP